MNGFRPQCCIIRLMRWILFWIMPVVQDRSLDLLTSSPACYHCTTDARMLNKYISCHLYKSHMPAGRHNKTWDCLPLKTRKNAHSLKNLKDTPCIWNRLNRRMENGQLRSFTLLLASKCLVLRHICTQGIVSICPLKWKDHGL